jgi:hypothetical protein
MENKKILLPLGIVLVVTIIASGALAYVSKKSSGGVSDDTYVALAQCIKDSGAKFYGAFWCPHCQNQKKAFGNGADLLPYVECSLPDGKTQTEECKTAGVQSYPTWEFPGGGRATGEIKLASLAELTGCAMPEGTEQATE